MTNITKTETFSLTPKSLDEAMKYAEMMSKSSIIPKGYQGKPGDILVAVQMGAELGLKPIQSLQNIAVINGKPSIYGDACIALIQSHPEFEDIEEFIEGEADKQTAICILKRRGKTTQKSTFSVEDAKKAGLWNKPGPWMQYPKRMLQMRARGFALRNGFADALLGLILVEEAQDYKDITPSNSSNTSNNYTATTTTSGGNDSYSSSGVDKLMSKLKPVEEIIEEHHEIIEPEQTNEFVENNSASLEEQLSVLINERNVPSEVVKKWLDRAEVKNLSELSEDTLQKCLNYVHEKYPG